MNPSTGQPGQFEPVQPWREAILALPFACLCALGWTAWLPTWLAVMAALVPFAARRFAGTAQYASWASVYAAVLGLLAGEDLLRRLGAFFAALSLAYLIGAALDGVRDGTAWAWLGPVIVFGAWPGPWSALGALGLAMLGALENRRFRARGQLGHVRKEGIAALGLVAVAVAVLTFSLGRPSRIVPGLTSGPTAQTRDRPATLKTGPSGAFIRPGQAIDNARDQQSALVNISLQVVLVAMVLVIGLSILRMRLEARRGLRGGWTDMMPIIGMIVLVLAILAWSLLARGSSAEVSGSSPGAGPSDRTTVRNARVRDDTAQGAGKRPADPIWPVIVTLIVVIAAGAFFFYLARRAPGSHSDEPEVDAAFAATPDRIQATNRVREAYRAFLQLCAGIGLPKSDSETPLEFVVRLNQRHPDAYGASSRLTRLYEPVRYGQLADSSGALEAQRALRDLHGILEHEPSGLR